MLRKVKSLLQQQIATVEVKRTNQKAKSQTKSQNHDVLSTTANPDVNVTWENLIDLLTDNHYVSVIRTKCKKSTS